MSGGAFDVGFVGEGVLAAGQVFADVEAAERVFWGRCGASCARKVVNKGVFSGVPAGKCSFFGDAFVHNVCALL